MYQPTRLMYCLGLVVSSCRSVCRMVGRGWRVRQAEPRRAPSWFRLPVEEEWSVLVARLPQSENESVSSLQWSIMTGML